MSSFIDVLYVSDSSLVTSGIKTILLNVMTLWQFEMILLHFHQQEVRFPSRPTFF